MNCRMTARKWRSACGGVVQSISIQRPIMAKYEFVTIWRFKSPLAPVWELIYNSDRWPEWWKGVERVERVREGDEQNIGSISQYTWKSKLPYRLTFKMELTRVEPLSIIEGRAIGE